MPRLDDRFPRSWNTGRWSVAAVALAVLSVFAPVANALVPSTLSYQGVLTDNAGNLVADGPYNLTFSVYSVSSGGSALWTETQNSVAVSKGGFSVVLGSVTPLAVSFDRQLYLGVAVNGGAELVPRVPLTPAPQALALRLPYEGITNTFDPPLSIFNQSPEYAMSADPGMFAGGVLHDGIVVAGSPGAGFGYAAIESQSLGGLIQTWTPAGGLGFSTYVNSAQHGELDMPASGSNHGIHLSGDYSGLGDPYMEIVGASRSATFNMSASGDASVQLPANAISAGEILDEPGIAQGHVFGAIAIATGSTVTDLVSVTIIIPAAGYIVVEADGMHGIGGDGVSANQANFTIKDSPGGSVDNAHWFVSGFTAGSPNGLLRLGTSMRRTYFESAGKYTFYYQAAADNPASLSNYIWDPSITATYFPTSYGSVSMVASSADPATRGLETRAVAPAIGPGGERVASDAVAVDLRELELRAAKLRAAASQAELEVARARIARPPATKPPALAHRSEK